MQVRSDPLSSALTLVRNGPSRRGLGALTLFGRSLRFGLRRLDPAGAHSRAQDHGVGLRPRNVEAAQITGLGRIAVGPANEVVARAIGEILERLDAALAEPDQHRRGQALDLLQFVRDAERLALLIELRLDPGKVGLRARLDFGRGLGVEAFDHRELARLDIGDFLDGAEAFGSKQAGRQSRRRRAPP